MVSRITAMMIQGNNGVFLDTPDRAEYWICHDGKPHALMLSCPKESLPEMVKFVADLKAEANETKSV